MKKSEIKVGGTYKARISGNLVNVKVLSIEEHLKHAGYERYSGKPKPYVNKQVYRVLNLNTNRTTVFRSAAKFRYSVTAGEVLDEK